MKRYNTPLIYNSSVEAIKLFLPYILQTNPDTGIIYGINSGVPVNPIFSSGLTVNSGFTYSNGTEQAGYVMTCDAFGNAIWAPASAATPSSGVTSVTAGSGLSGNVTTGAITLVNTSPDQTVTITGGTNIQISGSYPNFGVNFTGTTGVGGTGTTNYISKWTGSTSLGNSLIYDNGTSVSIGTASPSSSSIFQTDSTNKGFLPPRMTESQRNAISSPAIGLMVYQTDGTDGVYVYKAAGWIQMI